jgi:hypothetical protein
MELGGSYVRGKWLEALNINYKYSWAGIGFYFTINNIKIKRIIIIQ